MSRFHYLPSLKFQSGNDACTKDIDCAGTLICVKHATWENISGLQYMRHDDEPGSNNYLPVDRPSSEFFCSCDQIFGYEGFDCLQPSSSTLFEIGMYVSTVVIAIFVHMLSLKIALNVSSRKKKLVTTLIYVNIAIPFVAASSIIRISDILNPTEFTISSKGEKLSGKLAFPIVNSFSFGLAVIAMLHIIYCWSSITQNVSRFRPAESKGQLRKRWIFVLFSEAVLFIGIIILVATENNGFSFLLGGPYIVFVMLACLYAAYQITHLIETVMLESPGNDMVAPIKTSSEPRPKISNLSFEEQGKRKKKNEKTKLLLRAIRQCAVSLFLAVLIGVAGAILIIQSTVLNVDVNFQTPEGGFARPFMIGNILVFNIALPIGGILVTHYLYQVLVKNKNLSKSSETKSVGDDKGLTKNEDKKNLLVPVEVSRFDMTSSQTRNGGLEKTEIHRIDEE